MVGIAVKWQAGVDIDNMQYMMTIDRDSTAVVLYSLEAGGMLIPQFDAPSKYDRGIFAGGFNALDVYDEIEYITISSIGNATDFGDLTELTRSAGATSNGTNQRGVFGGGSTQVIQYNVISYITISSIGNATDFGDLTALSDGLGGASNGTNERGVFSPIGGDGLSDVIEYITINSIGNSTNFGDLTVLRGNLSSTSNGTNERGVFCGGAIIDSPFYVDTIDYITINSAGNATDFGNLLEVKETTGATSNGTNERGVSGGGVTTGALLNVIEYITISSIGNSADFGDLTVARQGTSSTSNGTNDRGVWGGGVWVDSSYSNVIDYVTITSLGNADDFGDLTKSKRSCFATSNL